MKVKVIKHGAIGLIHSNRGKQSNRKLDEVTIAKAKQYLQEKYYDFGPTFASEKLDENHNIKINKETLRGIMTGMGIWKPKPRKQPKKKHFWRPRKENFGEMQQFDGSYHIWFGKEETCLLFKLPQKPEKEINLKLPAITQRKPTNWKPPFNHPWRRYNFNPKRWLALKKYWPMLGVGMTFLNCLDKTNLIHSPPLNKASCLTLSKYAKIWVYGRQIKQNSKIGAKQ